MHQIGVGVLGPLFRATDASGSVVAVKAFRLDLTPEQAERFADALHAVIGVGLSDSSIVPLLDAGLEAGVPYLVSECVAGNSLDVILRDASGRPGGAPEIAARIAAAVDGAHENGVMHGTLHLRDVIVDGGRVRVSGFGVANVLEHVGLRIPIRRPYAAPELVAGRRWGPEADRYAVAAIAYELLTGLRAAGSGDDVLARLRDLAGIDVADRAGLQQAFRNGLADDPSLRPPSARQFATAFATALGAVPEEPEAAAAPAVAPSAAAASAAPASAVEIAPAAAPPAAPAPAMEIEPIAPAAAAAEPAASSPTVEIEPITPSTVAAAPAEPAPALEIEPITPIEPADVAAGAPAGADILAPPDDSGSAPAEEEAFELVAETAIPDLGTASPREWPGDAARLDPPAGAPDDDDLYGDDEDFPEEDEDASAGALAAPAETPARVARRQSGAPAGQRLIMRSVAPLAAALVIGLGLAFALGLEFGTPAEAPEGASPVVLPAADTASPTAAPPAAESATRPAVVEAAPPPAAGFEAPLQPPVEPPAPPQPVDEAPAPADLPPPATARALTEPVDPAPADLPPPVATPAAPAPAAPVDPAPAPPPPAGPGSVYVDTRPPGAIVLMNGERVGVTPLLVPDVAAGAHQLRLEMPGYLPWATEVTVAAEEELRVGASLQPDGSR